MNIFLVQEFKLLLVKSRMCVVKVAPQWFVCGGVFPIGFSSLAEESLG